MRKGKRSTRLWLCALSVLSISAVVIFVFTGGTGVQQKGMLIRPADAGDHSKGNAQSPVTVVVYSDFQCPTCADFNKAMQRIEADYDSRVRFVHRHFPLPQHQYSPLAAFACEAAGKQGKYFEMRDRLFATAGEWSGSSKPLEYFEKLAVELELDVTQFRADSASKETMNHVVEDFHSAVKSGANQTPSAFVNNRLIDGEVTDQQLRRTIDETLKSR